MLFSANVTEMADDVLTIRILLSLKTQREKITSHHSGQTLTNDFVVKNKNYQYQTKWNRKLCSLPPIPSIKFEHSGGN